MKSIMPSRGWGRSLEMHETEGHMNAFHGRQFDMGTQVCFCSDESRYDFMPATDKIPWGRVHQGKMA